MDPFGGGGGHGLLAEGQRRVETVDIGEGVGSGVEVVDYGRHVVEGRLG